MKKIILMLIALFASLNLNCAEPAPKSQKGESGQAIVVDPNASIKDLILAGNVQEVSKRLQQDPTLLNFRDEEGSTLLMLAIVSNSLPMFNEILSKVPNNKIDEKNPGGFTALMLVPKFAKGPNGLIFARALLQKDARLQTTNNNSTNSLMFACYFGRVELVKLFLEQSCYNISASAVPDINGLNINFKNRDGESALNEVIIGFLNLRTNIANVQDVIKILLQKGADINAFSNIGRTPLLLAIESLNLELVKFLLDNGANINLSRIGSRRSFSPLTWAIYYHSTSKDPNEKNKLLEIIELLIQKGASLENVPLCNAHPGQYIITLSPLLYAAALGDYDVVRLLLEAIKLKIGTLKAFELAEKAFKIAQHNYSSKYTVLSQSDRSDYLKTIRYLGDPYAYLTNEGHRALTTELLQSRELLLSKSKSPKEIVDPEHNFPEEIADIVGEYITGSHNGDDACIDAVKKYIHDNNFNKLTDIFRNHPEFLIIKNSLGETPLIAAVKEQSSQAVSLIIDGLRSLPDFEKQKLDKKEKSIVDLGVPTREQAEQLQDIASEIYDFNNNLHTELMQAYQLAHAIGNAEIINILEQYRNAFQVNA